jgi:hypothetical protein
MHELDYSNDQGGTTDANRLSQTVSVVPPHVPATTRENVRKIRVWLSCPSCLNDIDIPSKMKKNFGREEKMRPLPSELGQVGQTQLSHGFQGENRYGATGTTETAATSLSQGLNGKTVTERDKRNVVPAGT